MNLPLSCQQAGDAPSLATSPISAGTLLDARGLGVTLRTGGGAVELVRDVDVAVDRGEIVGLIGESGCGKSLSSMALLKLLPANMEIRGSVMFDGQDIGSLSPKAMRRVRGREISMVFQEPMTALDPVYPIGSQITEVIRSHEDVTRAHARDRSLEMLGLVGIPDPKRRFDEYPHQLSGGMRQRVMIAMALVTGPKLLIADEPTTAVDVTVQAQILRLLRRLNQELGTAILLITHDIGVVAEICARVIVMYAGEVVEECATDAVLCSPQHPYTSGLLRATPRPGVLRLEPIPGSVPQAGQRVLGCRFHPRCPWAADECLEPQQLIASGAAPHGHSVRCVRSPQLELPGVAAEGADEGVGS